MITATDKREAEVMVRNAEWVKIPFMLPNDETMYVAITKMEARRIINTAYAERDDPALAVRQYQGGRVFIRPTHARVEHAEQ